MVGSVHTTKTFLLVWTDPGICYTYPPHDAYIWSRRAKTAYCTKQNRDGTRKRKWAKEAKRDVGDKTSHCTEDERETRQRNIEEIKMNERLSYDLS
jgi:hypothetical protein